MRPRVVQLLGDAALGGVRTVVEGVCGSSLAERFDFAIAQADGPWPEGPVPDVIVLNQACSWRGLPGLLRLRARHPRARLVVHEHHYCAGFEARNVPSRSRFRWMLRSHYRIADRVVAVSAAQAGWMRRARLVDAARLATVRLGRPLEALLELPAAPGGERLVLGAYGRLCRQKGFDVLLRAMRRLPPERFALRLGGEGPDLRPLQELGRGLGHVEFCGRVDDVPNFLRGCDAVVIPSRWEPGATIGVEVRAAGRPMVASDVDALPEQVRDAGLLVPAGDARALADALASLPGRDLTAWGRRARDSVKGSWEGHLAAWEAVLAGRP